MREIHAWDIPELRVLRINKNFANLIKEKLKKHPEVIQLLIKETNYKKDTIRKFLAKIKKGKISGTSIPFSFLMKVCELLNIDKFDIEKSLMTIKTTQMKCMIKKCKFPIKVDAVFISFLFHHYGDGCGRAWAQRLSHRMNRLRYFEKAEYIVGKITNWKSKRRKEVMTPSIFFKTF